MLSNHKENRRHMKHLLFILECGPLAVALCTEFCLMAEGTIPQSDFSYVNTFTNVRDDLYACLAVSKIF